MLNPRRGAHPRADPRPRLELRLRRRRARAGDLHQLSAQEGRRRGSAADPHRARRRLLAAAAAGAERCRCAPGCCAGRCCCWRRSGWWRSTSSRTRRSTRTSTTGSISRLESALDPVSTDARSNGVERHRLRAGQGRAGRLRRSALRQAATSRPAAPRSTRPATPWVSGATRTAMLVGKIAVLSTGSTKLATPRFPAKLAVGHGTTVGSVGSSLKSASPPSHRRPSPAPSLVAIPLARRPRRRSTACCSIELARHRRGTDRPGRARLVGRSASACGRSTAWATGRARSPPATSAQRVEPGNRAHRGRPPGAGAERDAGPDREGLRRAASRARTACGASSPTPRTSCARRCRRSAATRSCSASAPLGPGGDRARRCGGSRRRRAAWACWWRTCSRSRGWTRCASRCAGRSTCARLARDAVDDARAVAPERSIESRRTASPPRCSATATSCAR